MIIKQLTVFLENRVGYLDKVLSILLENRINIIGITIADSSEYGLVRMIVSNPNLAFDKLQNSHLSVRIDDVLSLELDELVGSLAETLYLFTAETISIDYIYTFSLYGKNILVLKCDNMEKSVRIVKKNALKAISKEDIEL